MPTTDTEDMPIISPAVLGVSMKEVPSTGRSRPEASGIEQRLYAKEKKMFSLICARDGGKVVSDFREPDPPAAHRRTCDRK